MANHVSALKRARQDAKKRAANRMQKSTMRTLIKKVDAAIAAGDQEAAKTALQAAQSLLARAGRKRLIHPAQAARKTARLNAAVKAIG